MVDFKQKTFENKVNAKLDGLESGKSYPLEPNKVTKKFKDACIVYAKENGCTITIDGDEENIIKLKKDPVYLFFDTETTGLPKNWQAPHTDLDNWPRLVQIAWVIFDENGKELSDANYIIKPDGFEIPAASSDVHGITTETAIEQGDDLYDVMNELAIELEATTLLIAHNIAFDEKIVGAEFIRSSVSNNLFDIKQVCTMLKSVDHCQLPGPRGFKWPKLQELHKNLFGKEFEDAHDALADIRATADCFWEMKKIGLL